MPATRWIHRRTKRTVVCRSMSYLRVLWFRNCEKRRTGPARAPAKRKSECTMRGLIGKWDGFLSGLGNLYFLATAVFYPPRLGALVQHLVQLLDVLDAVFLEPVGQ